MVPLLLLAAAAVAHDDHAPSAMLGAAAMPSVVTKLQVIGKYNVNSETPAARDGHGVKTDDISMLVRRSNLKLSTIYGFNATRQLQLGFTNLAVVGLSPNPVSWAGSFSSIDGFHRESLVHTSSRMAQQVLVRVDKCGIFAKAGEEHSLSAHWRGIWTNISAAMAPSVRQGARRFCGR